ncbi:hypothetical protein KKA50_02430 [Patescibacteria group bacterium]|nr:hypothetical protein [Patescibacteria group bacterium]
MDTIPPVFWMIIVSVLTVMTCLILYYIAMLIKETRTTVADARDTMKQATKMLQQLELIVNDVQSSVSAIRGTVEEVNQSILAPIRKIAGGILTASAFLGSLKKNKQETEE